MRVNEVCAALGGICRSTCYNLFKENKLHATNLIQNGGFESFLYIEPVFGRGTVGKITGEISTIEPGNIVAGLNITNIPVGGLNSRIFVAMYDDTNNQLKSFYIISEQALTAEDAPKTIAKAVNVPDDGNKYSIRVMIWEKTDDYAGKSLWDFFELK